MGTFLKGEKMLVIIGWVLWAIVCLWAVGFLLAAIVLYQQKRDLGLLRFRLLIVACNVVSLFIPIAYDISKFHLLWLVPVSFIVALLLMPFLLSANR